MTHSEYPARSHFVDLCYVEALIINNQSKRPSFDAPVEIQLAWCDSCKELADQRDAEHSAVRHLLCAKCGGSGTTPFKHRHGGDCYSCHGRGWSARGRKFIQDN